MARLLVVGIALRIRRAVDAADVGLAVGEEDDVVGNVRAPVCRQLGTGLPQGLAVGGVAAGLDARRGGAVIRVQVEP